MATNGHGLALDFSAIPMEGPSGGGILEDLVAYISRFVVLSRAQAVIGAVYVLHTHTIDAADFTPYIYVNSAVMRSGKTRALEVFELFVARPWLTSRVSPAVLVRKVAKQRPTLLLDESDTAFSAEKEYSEALRGILNSGFQRGGCASLCVKRDGDWEPQDFPTFGPKVIAGIGLDKLPPTVKDRSIPIILKRKMSGETAGRFRKKNERTATQPLRDQIATWAKANVGALREVPDPPVLEALNDRQQDVCDPLLQIVRVIGGEWPEKLEQALREVCGTADSSDESLGIKLLSDIRSIFQAGDADRITSTDLIAKLKDVDTSPWSDWGHGKGLTPHSLSRLLKDFGIEPKKIRFDTATMQGYSAEHFTETWTRYLSTPIPLPLQNGTSEQTNIHAGETHFSETEQKPPVPDEKSEESSMFTRVVPDVPDRKPGMSKGRVEGDLGRGRALTKAAAREIDKRMDRQAWIDVEEDA